MYFSYVFAWIYKVMQVPVPIVLSSDLYSLVTIFDIFMFTVYIAIFVILIRFIITDTLSFNVGSVSDFSYHVKTKADVVSEDPSVKSSKTRTVRRQNFSNNSIGGRIINKKRQSEQKTLNKNSMGHRIVMSKFKNKESE